DLDTLAVKYPMADAHVIGPHPRYVDVSVGQEGRRGHRIEKLSVLRGDRLIDLGRWVAYRCPQLARHLPRRVELLRGAQADELSRVLWAEQVSEDSLGMVGVVEEKQEIAEADQRVGTITGSPQRVASAVYVADHMKAH